MQTYSYPVYRIPEDIDAERRCRAVDVFIRSLCALLFFFAGVWVALAVTA